MNAIEALEHVRDSLEGWREYQKTQMVNIGGQDANTMTQLFATRHRIAGLELAINEVVNAILSLKEDDEAS